MKKATNVIMLVLAIVMMIASIAIAIYANQAILGVAIAAYFGMELVDHFSEEA